MKKKKTKYNSFLVITYKDLEGDRNIVFHTEYNQKILGEYAEMFRKIIFETNNEDIEEGNVNIEVQSEMGQQEELKSVNISHDDDKKAIYKYYKGVIICVLVGILIIGVGIQCQQNSIKKHNKQLEEEYEENETTKATCFSDDGGAQTTTNAVSSSSDCKKTKVEIGMTKDEVMKIKGKPEDINRTTAQNKVNEQWCYRNNYYVYFENGIVTTIQD